MVDSVAAESSSMIVNVRGDGASNPGGPVTVPATVTCSSGPSASSSNAVTVTVPVLAVLPARMVSSRFALSAKSSESAGDTADAETVTVTSLVVTRLSCAVTRLSPPSSDTRSGVSTSVTVGAPSSSVIVRVGLLPAGR